MSDISLENTEKYMRGDGKSNEWTECGGHGNTSYNRTSDTRYESSPMNPNVNENSTIRDRSRLCSIKRQAAEDIENIPLSQVMDVISNASKNVAILTQRKLNAPPVPIISAKKTDPSNTSENNGDSYGFLKPYDVVKMFEIWKVFLEKNNQENIDFVYIILSSDYTLHGYADGKWENIEYRGFYTTLDEAKNEISGYLR